MPQNLKPADPNKIIRIEVIDLPTQYEKGEGEYEVRLGSAPKDKLYHDLFSLEKWLNEIWPERTDDILSRLQNFRKAFINLGTGEITT